MGRSFQDSGRYASLHESPEGPGDARPTSLQILKDNDVINQMQDKVILVTGGSNGLGVDEVKAFARTGAKVFFTSRDVAKGEKVKADILKELEGEASTPKIEVIQMDLQSLESVRVAADDFKKRSGSLNVLVNNAGIAMTPHRITGDGFEQQFQVNHLAHFYLFHLLKPLLLKSTTSSFNSRVVSVASSAHAFNSAFLGDYNLEKRGYNPMAAYGHSKTCNIWMANELERRYGRQCLHCISVHPGGIITGLSDHHDESVYTMLNAALEMPHIKTRMKSVEQGSASIVLAAIGKEYEGVGGFFMEDCGLSPPMADDAPLGMPGYKPWAYNEGGEKQLWSDSLQLLKLQDD